MVVMAFPSDSFWHALELVLATRFLSPLGGFRDRGTAGCCGPALPCYSDGRGFTPHWAPHRPRRDQGPRPSSRPETQATGAHSPSPQGATRLSSLRPGVHVGAAP